MPSIKRTWFKGAMYHIMNRGIRRTSLFHDDEDREMYLMFLAMVKLRFPFHLHSLCLMPNHIHLQIETIDYPPWKIMQALNSSYAMYFNKKHHYSGSVFERRYRSKLILSRRYELELSRYIHLNPLRAGLTDKLEEYVWSSFKSYVHGQNPSLVKTCRILSYFPYPRHDNYIDFILSFKPNPLTKHINS
ncbi:transposase [Bacillus sp. FJAT-27225]|uniref:transposase n=1 Tax=Bacillus sp. FJAT-27225 TaxID=1743144 RepID=UPI0009808BBC